MKLSIVIPAYNEKNTILKIVERVKQVNLGKIEKEIILVDDASRDGTTDIIKKIKDNKIKKVFHEKNQGKGAAVRDGIKAATGEIVIIQDADLEYNPDEYNIVIKPILDKKAEVVYGSRALNKNNRYSYISFMIGGKIVTFFTNLLFFSHLTDEPTCYKTFKSDVIKKINITGNRFEWEPEVTAKILKKGIKIVEVPISYNPRDKKHGKKINWRDGLVAIWTLFKYRFSD
jgi:dolichol-phosphate mannosyltransferase